MQDQLLGPPSPAPRTPLLGAPLVPGQALGAPHWERRVLRILEFPWAGGFRFRRPAGSTSRRRVPLPAGGSRFRLAGSASGRLVLLSCDFRRSSAMRPSVRLLLASVGHLLANGCFELVPTTLPSSLARKPIQFLSVSAVCCWAVISYSAPCWPYHDATRAGWLKPSQGQPWDDRPLPCQLSPGVLGAALPDLILGPATLKRSHTPCKVSQLENSFPPISTLVKPHTRSSNSVKETVSIFSIFTLLGQLDLNVAVGPDLVSFTIRLFTSKS